MLAIFPSSQIVNSRVDLRIPRVGYANAWNAPVPEADVDNDQQNAARIERIPDNFRDTLINRLWNATN